jgi:uncharacterized LabA/DUF88 family protein
MPHQKESNIAFVDGQNLHLSTQTDGRTIDMKKFRIYLRDKFHVTEAYYFLWFMSLEEQDLYTMLQKAGFIVVFREHAETLVGKKKGNVDVDMVFEIMKRTIDNKDFDKMVIVSGDGDYVKLIRRLIEKKLLKKIIFPNHHYSSLYKDIKHLYGMNLGTAEIKKKISYIKADERKKATTHRTKNKAKTDTKPQTKKEVS